MKFIMQITILNILLTDSIMLKEFNITTKYMGIYIRDQVNKF